MHVVRASGVEYYVRDLMPDRAGGPPAAGESQGRWTGRASASLGLDGRVTATGFTEVLAGRDPSGGRPLRTVRGGRPVSGFDFTFCAPKSVSVLHLLGPSELGAAAGAAHESAVGDALGFLELHGHGVRRARSGRIHLMASTGAVAAGFVHRTSRSLDPHLHTHLVTANVAQGVDGTWSSLDSRRLFVHRRVAGAVYGASLRHHLTEAAGVAWRRSPSGGWEVDGVDPVLCRLLSQRTAAIDEHTHGFGDRRSAAARRVAFHADREDKGRGGTLEGLRAAWRRRADALGLDPGELVRTVGRAPSPSDRRAAHLAELAPGLDRLAAGRARPDAREVMTAVATSAPFGLPAGGADRLVAALRDAVGSGGGGPGRTGGWDACEMARVVRTDPDGVLPDVRGPEPGRVPGLRRHDRSPSPRIGRAPELDRAGPDLAGWGRWAGL